MLPTLAECLISMILVVTPATEGMGGYLPTTWLFYRPLAAGICNTFEQKQSVHILITEAHQVILTFAKWRYIIPLPPNAITARSNPESSHEFRLVYVLGEQFARIGDQYKVIVRMGPEGFQ